MFCPVQKEFYMGTKLYVGNLSYQTQEYDLRDHFAQHGEVVSASIVSDRDTGRSRGFGFVEMSSEEEAQRAQQALDGKDLDGRQLKVNEAKGRGEGGGGGGGRRDRW
jgi:RNA recognition motif-containing protein